MSTVSLDLQRRCEQRWAARFKRAAEPAVTPEHQPEKQDRQLTTPRKGKRKPRRLSQSILRAAPAT
jgi:hypothetical protein